MTDTNDSSHSPKDSFSSFLGLILVISILANLFVGVESSLFFRSLFPMLKDATGQIDPHLYQRIQVLGGVSYSIASAIGGIVIGLLSDRFNRLTMLGVVLTIMGTGICLAGAMPSWEYIILVRTITGGMAAGIAVLTTTILTDLWPRRSRAVVVGSLAGLIVFGTLASSLLSEFISNWRIWYAAGLFPLLLGSGALKLFKNSVYPIETKANTHSPDVNVKDLIVGIAICTVQFVGVWGVTVYMPTWYYFVVANGNVFQYFAILFSASLITGSLISGWLSNMAGTWAAMLISFGGYLVIAIPLFVIPTPSPAVVYVQVFLMGTFMGLTDGLLLIYIPRLFAPSIRGTFTGICLNAGMLLNAGLAFAGSLGSYHEDWFVPMLLGFSSMFFIALILVLAAARRRLPDEVNEQTEVYS